MARTSNDIFQTMETAKNAEPTLQGLTSISQTALWRLFLWIVAVAHHYIEVLFDGFKNEVSQIAANAQVANLAWYQQEIFKFQLGDNLAFVDNRYKYAAFDAAKKVVKRCVVVEDANGKLTVKVAKQNGQNLEPLSISEQQALVSYIKKIRIAGTRFILVSTNGDILKLTLNIYFDPLILQATVKENVELAINNYIKNLPFNGEFLISHLVDALQKVEGVKDVLMGSVESKYIVTDSYQNIVRNHVPIGGYYRISTDQNETLNDTIQYYIA
jgi:hypothetical protein